MTWYEAISAETLVNTSVMKESVTKKKRYFNDIYDMIFW